MSFMLRLTVYYKFSQDVFIMFMHSGFVLILFSYYANLFD